MFSWLFGSKKKPGKKKPGKKKPSSNLRLKKPPAKSSPPLSKKSKPSAATRALSKEKTDKVVEQLGSPQELALIVKSMLAEDKLNERAR